MKTILILMSLFPLSLLAQKNEKFIPTYFIRYGGNPTVTLSAELTARFDLAIVGPGFNQLWSEDGQNSWLSLKKYNPDMVIALYQMGPGEYNTSDPLGNGLEWIKANHGADAGNERWTGSGHKYPYLADSNYPNERLMNLGNPGWQKYWVDKTYENRYTGENLKKYEGADAIFADNAQYKVIWPNLWYDENHVRDAAFKDHPLDYATAAGVYDHAKWAEDMRAFFNLAVPSLASRTHPVKIITNFAYSGSNPEYWIDLDSQENPVFGAMDEGAFSQPWGKTYNVFDWEQKIITMKNLKHVAAVMNNYGKVREGTGMEKMDIVMPEGNYGPSTGWDALWYSLTSFLMALNEDKTNGYFGFCIWNYGSYYWMDEYDPKFLHLGKPVGDYYIPKSGPAKDVAFREYEDGWVVANVANTNAKTNVPVPKGKAYIVNHSNLKDPYGKPVTTFDIGKNRGLILLKKGKEIGNGDN